jgi:Tol biopolymer transport system component
VQLRRPSGGSAVAIVPADGGAIKVLTNERGESWPNAWSADEKRIAFAGRRDGVWNVWTVDVATGVTRRITNNESTSVWFRSPALSPAGGAIAYESGVSKGNVWVSEPRL